MARGKIIILSVDSTVEYDISNCNKTSKRNVLTLYSAQPRAQIRAPLPRPRAQPRQPPPHHAAAKKSEWVPDIIATNSS